MSNWRGNEIYNVQESCDDFDDRNSSCGSSCDSSCCDYHSDESVPEWNNAVLENGELFFIKCSPFIDVKSRLGDSKSLVAVNKRYKISKFLKKRKAKKQATSDIKNQNYKENLEPSKPDNVSNFLDIEGQLAAVLFIDLAGIEHEELIPGDNVIYCFPQIIDKNVIYSIRGALLTLYHLLLKLVAEEPESSTVLIEGELLHLIYTSDGKELLIIALPEHKCSLFELKQLNLCIVRYLNFKYKSLHECFKNAAHHISLNQFFGNSFVKMFKNTLHEPSTSNCSYNNSKNDSTVQFEDAFGLPSKLTIPHHLQVKVEEKLNEIEANDFGDLSENHYGCQRLYTISGSCLYHKGYLIASHLSKEDQLDVHTFLRLNDLLDLSVTSTIESLVIWKEVFMSSCSYCVEGLRTFPSNKRWFLLVIGQDQSLLAILLESGGCSVRVDGISKPDELYIDEFQEVLYDILHFGLADIVEQSMKNNSKVSTLQKYFYQKSSENLSTNSSHTNNLNKSSSTLSCESDSNLHHSSPSLDDTYSDSLSRTNSSIFNDEGAPVIGRRAQRMKQLSSSGSIFPLQSNFSDSDRSDLDTTGSSHSSSFADVGKKSPKELNMKKKIIHGNNQALFHYVNLQFNSGIMISPLTANDMDDFRYHSIMNHFRLSARKIHCVLSQKKSCNIGRLHRNSLPVKEFGLLFEYDEPEEKKASVVYWVIGRTFNKNNLGEIYVCFEDKTPQNVVEMAFRLASST